MPSKKTANPVQKIVPGDGEPPEAAEHDDACRCEGCVNVNYPRNQAVKDAEHRELCLRMCTPEQLAWHKAFRPETWVIAGEQLEMFR